jgi:hypothetical protein
LADGSRHAEEVGSGTTWVEAWSRAIQRNDEPLRHLFAGFRRRVFLHISPSGFAALPPRDAGFLGSKFVGGASAVSGFSPFAPREAGFLGSKFVGGASAVSGFSALAPGEAGFLGIELMRRPFLMSGFAASTGNLALFGGVHRGKSSSVLGNFRHGDDPP